MPWRANASSTWQSEDFAVDEPTMSGRISSRKFVLVAAGRWSRTRRRRSAAGRGDPEDRRAVVPSGCSSAGIDRGTNESPNQPPPRRRRPDRSGTAPSPPSRMISSWIEQLQPLAVQAVLHIRTNLAGEIWPIERGHRQTTVRRVQSGAHQRHPPAVHPYRADVLESARHREATLTTKLSERGDPAPILVGSRQPHHQIQNRLGSPFRRTSARAGPTRAARAVVAFERAAASSPPGRRPLG